MFSVRIPDGSLEPTFRIVLAVRQDGMFLVPGDEQPPKLYWIEPQGCELGQRYMDQDQREWWRSLTQPQR